MFQYSVTSSSYNLSLCVCVSPKHVLSHHTCSSTFWLIYFVQIFSTGRSVQILPFLTQKRKFSRHRPPVATCRPSLSAIMPLPHLPNTRRLHEKLSRSQWRLLRRHMAKFLYLKWAGKHLAWFTNPTASSPDKRKYSRGQTERVRVNIYSPYGSSILVLAWVLTLTMSFLVSFFFFFFCLRCPFPSKYESLWCSVQRNAYFVLRGRCCRRSVRPVLLLSYWFS